MNLEDDRFSLKKGDVSFVNTNGEYIENEKKYFNNRKKEMLTISDKLQIGDVVKLKLTGEVVTIVKIDFAGFSYAGEKLGENELTLFSQEDIEEIISKSHQKRI